MFSLCQNLLFYLLNRLKEEYDFFTDAQTSVPTPVSLYTHLHGHGDLLQGSICLGLFGLQQDALFGRPPLQLINQRFCLVQLSHTCLHTHTKERKWFKHLFDSSSQNIPDTSDCSWTIFDTHLVFIDGLILIHCLTDLSGTLYFPVLHSEVCVCVCVPAGAAVSA